MSDETQITASGVSTAIITNLYEDGCLTIHELNKNLNLTHTQITASVSRLIDREIVERVEAGCYQLTKSGNEAVSQGLEISSGKYKPSIETKQSNMRNTIRQRTWNVMRISSVFSYADLTVSVNQNDPDQTKASIQKYIAKLVKSGFVIELNIRRAGVKLTSNGFKQFRLIKDTGPIAPTFQTSKKRVFDHNTREFFPCN